MFDILSIIPGKKKTTQSGWTSFNAVCCHHRGHKADKRGRGGIVFDGEYNWSYHCFNCNFKCGFTIGKPISKNTKQLLHWCGVDDEQINKWNIDSLKNRDLIEYIKIKKNKKIKFKETILPDGELIDHNNPEHKKYVEYLMKRGVDNYPALTTPNDFGRNSSRVIIPFTYENKIVGHTSRFLDNHKPKYISEVQIGYVFGYDLQKPDWEFCIVMEGVFDALAISGCAVLHATISPEQADLLAKLNRQIIVVPDQDFSGMEMIDRALDLGYKVSIPEWGLNKGSPIKDVSEAVEKYGKLPVLLSIIQNSTTNKVLLKMRRDKIVQREAERNRI